MGVTRTKNKQSRLDFGVFFFPDDKFRLSCWTAFRIRASTSSKNDMASKSHSFVSFPFLVDSTDVVYKVEADVDTDFEMG